MSWNHPLVAAVLTAISAAAASAQSSPWKEGEPLPALRLPTIDGTETIDLRGLRGKRTLLVEFASW